MNLKVGLGQINPTVGNFQGNTEKITEFIRQAEDGGCDLVVFPELAVCGYPVWDLAKKKNFLDRSLKAVEDITKATEGLHVTAVVGFIDQAKDPKHRNYNSLAVIRDGKVIFRQAKTLLPTYDVFLEEIFFAPGKSRSLFSIGDLTCGALICEDIWDDEYETKPAQDLKRQGAQAIVNIAASPYASKGVEKRRQILQTKAKTLGLWIFYVNQVCGQDDLIFDGRSVI
jgi:NAD+ synthase (glutamine-hydrolysing)